MAHLPKARILQRTRQKRTKKVNKKDFGQEAKVLEEGQKAPVDCNRASCGFKPIDGLEPRAESMAKEGRLRYWAGRPCAAALALRPASISGGRTGSGDDRG